MVIFPPVVPGDDIVISATAFVAFLQCPEQAAARYRGEYGPESPASFRGGLAHRIFARHLQQGPIPGEQFSQVCRAEIGAGMNPKMAALSMRPSQLGAIIEEVGALYERFKSVPYEGFRDAEVLLEVEPADGVILKGGIDAIFDDPQGARLVDWKTGQLPDSTSDQLAFYALLWTLDRGDLPAKVEAVSVATGQRAGAVPGLDDLDRTAGRVATMVDELRGHWAAEADFDRDGGPWCRYCPMLEGCAEGQAAQRVLSAR